MKQVVKSVLALFLGVVILMAGLFLSLTMFVNPNDYKGEIIQLVKEKTGRELLINGEISLTFFPWIGVKLGEVTLNNAEGFGTTPFVGVESVKVRVKLMPLLSKRLVADSILIRGLQLNLAKNRQGVGNWADLVPAPPGEESVGDPSMDSNQPLVEESSPSPSAPMAIALAIGGIQIENAALTWQDEQAQTNATIRPINLTTGPLQPGKPFDLTLSFGLSSNVPPLTSTLTLSAQATFDLAAQRYQLARSKLTVTTQGASIPGGSNELQLDFDVLADLARESLEVNGINLSTLGTNLSGTVSGNGILSNPRFKGDLTLAEMNLRNLLGKLSDQPVVTSDPKVLQRLSSRLAFSAGLDEVTLNPLTLNLDDSVLTGSVAVGNFAKPAVRFNLDLDRLDVDRYLPPKQQDTAGTAGQSSGNKTGSSASSQSAPPSLDPIRALNLDGHFKARELKVANAQLSNFKLGVKANGGVVNVKPLAVDLYQGHLNADARMDARSDSPILAVRYDLKGVQAGPLIEDVSGLDRLSGSAQSFADITTRGLDERSIKKNLNGKANFLFENGALKGINVARMIRNAYNLLKGLPAEPEDSVQQTDFSRLSGSATIRNGVVNNQDLSMSSPLLRISSSGNVDLPGNRIDYLAKASIVGTLQGQNGKPIDELKNITVPVKVTGSLDAPQPTLDLAAILQESVKKQAQQKLKDKLEEKLKSKGVGEVLEKAIPGGGDELIKKLFSF